jgi:hypothetical protein
MKAHISFEVMIRGWPFEGLSVRFKIEINWSNLPLHSFALEWTREKE